MHYTVFNTQYSIIYDVFNTYIYDYIYDVNMTYSKDQYMKYHPKLVREQIVFTIGAKRRGIGGLLGPAHSPQKIMFSAFIRILAGRFKITKWTGHKPTGDDYSICAQGKSQVDWTRKFVWNWANQ